MKYRPEEEERKTRIENLLGIEWKCNTDLSVFFFQFLLSHFIFTKTTKAISTQSGRNTQRIKTEELKLLK